MKLKSVFKRILDARIEKRIIKERLYYLTGVKPIGSNKVLEECTVTKN